MEQRTFMIRKNIFLGMCFFVVFQSYAELQEYTFKKPFKRPKSVQNVVDEVFEDVKNESTWYKNGSYQYGLFYTKDEKFVDLVVSGGKKDVYIMDVGCGQGDWGHHIKEYLEKKYKDTNITFHIFSLTGGEECSEETSQSDKVILHQLNQFKIENIDEELKKRGFDLENKVDLIVSRWTLRHLVDPFGTLDKMYGLLTSSRGKIVSNGFLFKLADSQGIKACPNYYEGSYILANSNATVLFNDYDGMRDAGEFLLERNDEKSLGIPLEYVNRVKDINGYAWQCASNKVTEFVEDEENIKNKNRLVKKLDGDRFCLDGDGRCKDFYERLRQQGFFEKPKA